MHHHQPPCATRSSCLLTRAYGATFAQRLRYFLLAKRAPHSFAWTPLAMASSSTVDPLRFVPDCAEQAATAADAAQPEPAAVAPLSDFLEPDDSLSVHVHRVPDALVRKKGLLFGSVPSPLPPAHGLVARECH